MDSVVFNGCQKRRGGAEMMYELIGVALVVLVVGCENTAIDINGIGRKYNHRGHRETQRIGLKTLCALCPLWLNPVAFTACVESIRPQQTFHSLRRCAVAPLRSRLFNLFRISSWQKKIYRRGRRGSQRVVILLCVPLRSLRSFESSRKIIKRLLRSPDLTQRRRDAETQRRREARRGGDDV